MSSVNSRQREIEKLLHSQGTVHIHDLSALFHASLDTIRRDLRQMEDAGSLRRIHGGATLPSTAREGFHDRAQDLKPERSEIARKVAHDLVPDHGVIFFDSDDLMTLNHIQTKLKTITKFNLDYVVAKTKFLYDDDDNSLERYYKFTQFNISAHNYITQNINWLTYDALIKSSLAKQISFNEHLQSGQEYNYFSKLVLKSVNAQFISEYLTLRRKHSASKQADLKSNKKLKRRSSFVSTWVTYQEIYQDLSRETKKIILFKIIDYYYYEKKIPKRIFFLSKHLNMNFSRGRSTFIAMLISEILFSKGYKFRQYFKKQLKY